MEIGDYRGFIMNLKSIRIKSVNKGWSYKFTWDEDTPLWSNNSVPPNSDYKNTIDTQLENAYNEDGYRRDKTSQSFIVDGFSLPYLSDMGFSNLILLSSYAPNETDTLEFEDGYQFYIKNVSPFEDGYKTIHLTDNTGSTTGLILLTYGYLSSNYDLQSSTFSYVKGNSVFINRFSFHYDRYKGFIRWSEHLNYTPSAIVDNFIQHFKDNTKNYTSDPYDPGGVDPGNPNGGDGTYDDTSDLVPIPEDYPNFSLPGRGFFRIWVPTAQQLSSIAEWLWTSDFVEHVKKMFGSPMEAIFSLFALPVTGITSTPNTMVLGNVNTNITVNQTGETFVTVDCGTFDLKRYWGSALDYSPNTRISIYLPYIGVVALNVDDIQQTQLQVVYRINLITGDFVCLISANGQLIYHYTSNCAFGIPISAADYSNTISHLLSNTALIGGVIAAAATGGLTAPAAVGAIGQSVVNAFSSKPQIQRSSGVSNSNGWLDKQKPYLIIERANQSLAAYANKFEGYPCNATFKIADLQGYTEVENIHLENIPATLEELSEIENIMKGGFII